MNDDAIETVVYKPEQAANRRSFEMLAVQDEQPVKIFISDGSHETLGDAPARACFG